MLISYQHLKVAQFLIKKDPMSLDREAMTKEEVGRRTSLWLMFCGWQKWIPRNWYVEGMYPLIWSPLWTLASMDINFLRRMKKTNKRRSTPGGLLSNFCIVSIFFLHQICIIYKKDHLFWPTFLLPSFPSVLLQSYVFILVLSLCGAMFPSLFFVNLSAKSQGRPKHEASGIKLLETSGSWIWPIKCCSEVCLWKWWAQCPGGQTLELTFCLSYSLFKLQISFNS